MNFMEAISTCFNKYFTVKGRAPRSEYWYFLLFLMICYFIADVADTNLLLGGAQPDPDDLGPVATIASLLTVIPFIAVSARRLHDINRSGWWQLLHLTFIGTLFLIYWHCKAGTAGPNDYDEKRSSSAPRYSSAKQRYM